MLGGPAREGDRIETGLDLLAREPEIRIAHDEADEGILSPLSL